LGRTNISKISESHRRPVRTSASGDLFFTNSQAAMISKFGPASREIAYYPVEGGAYFPHTIRVDARGRIWFTIIGSNQIGRFDPCIEKMDVVTLPENAPDEFTVPSSAPLPYGLDFNPLDGSVWYAKLLGNKIGRVDAETLRVEEFNSPEIGPRRLRFDARGIVWIALGHQDKVKWPRSANVASGACVSRQPG
jgi:virginiamycin B lyase